MDVSRDEVEPDTSVDLNFETKPNSYIGVAGIDQSVLLLKTGNDISHVSQVSILTTDRPPLTVYNNLRLNVMKSFSFSVLIIRTTYWTNLELTTTVSIPIICRTSENRWIDIRCFGGQVRIPLTKRSM